MPAVWLVGPTAGSVSGKPAASPPRAFHLQEGTADAGSRHCRRRRRWIAARQPVSPRAALLTVAGGRTIHAGSDKICSVVAKMRRAAGGRLWQGPRRARFPPLIPGRSLCFPSAPPMKLSSRPAGVCCVFVPFPGAEPPARALARRQIRPVARREVSLPRER